ncbi:hypothetical protein FZEAL_7742 [Fusarium zealandicum]|uniref:SCP domain-containing protein n=1 Tax=Fusarium zealandicum TaxID=1053134 RepID=A0A8H4UF63_9HYPO|nr:hypothetical protein FZEAL_7742 [Fusarium zealandicum]
MHFSILAIPMLATNAVALQHRHPHQNQDNIVYHTQYHVVTVTAGWDNAIVTPEPVVPEALEVEHTTFQVKTRKPKAPKAPKKAAPKPKAPAADTPSSSSSLTDDQQKALDAHNAARSDVGTDPLSWDDSLASDALEWATHLVSVGSLVHSDGSGQGENLYMGYGSSPFTDSADAFISEKSSYNGQVISESNYMEFGHYSQAVWKSTTKVGMAVAKGSNGETFVVARYSPPGNMIGEAAY